jgi:carbamoyl-phosphate synthase large subunit
VPQIGRDLTKSVSSWWPPAVRSANWKKPALPAARQQGDRRPSACVDMLKNGEISLIINTTEGKQAQQDSFSIRRSALQGKVYYTTTISGANAVCQALKFGAELSVLPFAGPAQGVGIMVRVPMTVGGA